MSGKSLDEFRSIHDKSFTVPKKIKEGLEKLGPKLWMYEGDFIRLCGLSVGDFAKYRDQFSDFYMTLPGKNPKNVWAGSKTTTDKMREMVS